MSERHSKIIGAIDQGTTSTRFILFDETGLPLAAAQREHSQSFPRPGWVEHDPIEIWRNTERVIAQALAEAGLKARDLAALGVTNQRETTILWDRRNGEPLAPAIVWQDTRVEPMVAAMAEDGGVDRFRPRTGLPLASYFSALKLRWLLDTVPGARALADDGVALFGTVDSWLVWRLTGRHVTDVTNASRTQLLNLASLDWDPVLLEAFDIPRACLPTIASSSEIYGQASGLLAGVPVAAILGDQQAALVGQACFAPGDVKNTYGTGCFMLMNTGTVPVTSTAGLLTTLAYKFGDEPAAYALEGSVAIAGALVQWLRDNLGILRSSGEIEALARSVADNGDVYVVPAFSGLYAPHWQPRARGIIAGLTRFADRGHLARAVLEATAYQTADVLDAMVRDGDTPIAALRVDGGMVANELLMQFQADIAGVPVLRPAVTETTALGAAYAAGLAVGIWRGTDELAAHWRLEHRWEPTMPAPDRSRLRAGWNKAVRRSLDWVD